MPFTVHAHRPGPERGSRTLGAVLAGGRSSRFGDGKALARVAGVSLVARAAAAVAGATHRAVVITGDDDTARAAGIPARPDRVAGAGPMGGLVTALEWATEHGADGVLLVGVDMPFLSSDALRRLLDLARAPATVPASDSGIGVQPLCAWYAVDLLTLAVERLETGRLQLRGLLDEIGANRVGESVIAGDLPPSHVFMNVNTREDLAAAELAARRMGAALG